MTEYNFNDLTSEEQNKYVLVKLCEEMFTANEVYHMLISNILITANNDNEKVLNYFEVQRNKFDKAYEQLNKNKKERKIYNLTGFNSCEGEIEFSGTNLVELLYKLWNYEMEVFDNDDKCLVFNPFESNESNNELLKPYGLELIDHGKTRAFRNLITKKIYEWEY